jgi:hypothetical protein
MIIIYAHLNEARCIPQVLGCKRRVFARPTHERQEAVSLPLNAGVGFFGVGFFALVGT